MLRIILLLALLGPTVTFAGRAEQVGFFDFYLERSQFAQEVTWEQLNEIFGKALTPYEIHKDWFKGRVWSGYAIMPRKYMFPNGALTNGPIYFSARNLETHFDKHADEINDVSRSGRISGNRIIKTAKKYQKCAYAMASSTSPKVITVIATSLKYGSPVLYRYDLAAQNLLILSGPYLNMGVTFFATTPIRFLDGLFRNTRRDLLEPR